jgi:LmeA-like phospholipid-binding
MFDSLGLGEQALNKVVEIGLSNSLDEVDNLDVDIKTDPLKLLTGQLDAVTIASEGLVMQKDLRIDELEMGVNNVAINPLSITFGKIELTQPTEGNTRVVLTEGDINRAFNSEYVRSQLQSQKIQVNGQSMTIDPQHIDFALFRKGKLALNASILLKESGETKQAAFSAIPRISANGQSVSLENVEFGESQEISPELTKALVDATSAILNLSNFDLQGMPLQLKQLEVKTGKITLQASA